MEWQSLKPPDHFLTVWVIFDHPDDEPQYWVLRPQFVLKGGAVEPAKYAWTANTLEECRALLPPGLVCMARDPADAPKIYETWI